MIPLNAFTMLENELITGAAEESSTVRNLGDAFWLAIGTIILSMSKSRRVP